MTLLYAIDASSVADMNAVDPREDKDFASGIRIVRGPLSDEVRAVDVQKKRAQPSELC